MIHTRTDEVKKDDCYFTLIVCVSAEKLSLNASQSLQSTASYLVEEVTLHTTRW